MYSAQNPNLIRVITLVTLCVILPNFVATQTSERPQMSDADIDLRSIQGVGGRIAICAILRIIPEEKADKYRQAAKQCLNENLPPAKRDSVVKCPHWNRLLAINKIPEMEQYCLSKEPETLVDECFLKNELKVPLFFKVKSCVFKKVADH